MSVEDRIREEARRLERAWKDEPRWEGIERPYSPADVVRL
jgi:isocitrate/methylisocitrate lyase